jgi:hypothetical protein
MGPNVGKADPPRAADCFPDSLNNTRPWGCSLGVAASSRLLGDTEGAGDGLLRGSGRAGWGDGSPREGSGVPLVALLPQPLEQRVEKGLSPPLLSPFAVASPFHPIAPKRFGHGFGVLEHSLQVVPLPLPLSKIQTTPPQFS